MNERMHVIPKNDFREHEATLSCWCNPTEDNGVVIHNALDEREKFETGQRLPC